jgi:thiol-disulfide isomerase/thioredoxin
MSISFRFKTASALILLAALSASASVVGDVRMKLSAGDLASAEAIVEDFHRTSGDTAEYSAAVSWLARGALMLHQPAAVEKYLAESRRLTAVLLKTAKLEDDAFLQAAVGATVEVEAKSLAQQGKRDQAIQLLQREMGKPYPVAIRSRIQKNINLLAVVGQPAPDIGGKYRGRPVLLFLWAHWCGDCRAQAPTMARLKSEFEPKGLVIVAPTRRYGSTPDSEKASAEQEDLQIEKVWREAYAGLGNTPHPVDEATMIDYGVSSTPTLVLVDRHGIVRQYQPFRVSETQLRDEINALLKIQ